MLKATSVCSVLVISWLAVGAVGCSQVSTDDDVSSSAAAGEPALGIARFTINDTEQLTTVIGLDAVGGEVGRMELTHGRFQVSPVFADDFPGMTEVEGRKLVANVRGQTFHWETAGFDPVLEMPAHPSDKFLLATFFDAPTVRDVLDRWGIGFEAFPYGAALGLEQAYDGGSGAFRGDSPLNCSGQTSCGTAYNNVTINTCSATAAAIAARRVTQRSGTNCGLYSSSVEQHIVSQCCPTGAGGQAFPWFAYKSCPTTSNRASLCGTVATGSACKGCGVYDASTTCSVTQGTTVGTCGANVVYPVNYSWTSPVTLTVSVSCDVASGGLSGSKSVYYNGNTITCFFDPANGPTSASRVFTVPYGTAATVTADTPGTSMTATWTVVPAPNCSGTSCSRTLTVNTSMDMAYVRDTCPTC